MSQNIAVIRASMDEHYHDSPVVRARLGGNRAQAAAIAASIADIIDAMECRSVATAVLDDLVLDCAEFSDDPDEGSDINNTGTAIQLAYLFSYNGMDTPELLRTWFVGVLPSDVLNKPPFVANVTSL